jgi:malate synthase
MTDNVIINGRMESGFENILSNAALDIIAGLHRKFNHTRKKLLNDRINVQAKLDSGWRPDFLEETIDIRNGDWTVAEIPADLKDRRLEITGPVDVKMMINALNSGAKVFMADLEDSCSPTWSNVITGQINLRAAIRKALEFTSPEGKQYSLNADTAVLFVRPRGWHLEDKHIKVDGELISASLMDFGLYLFHNAHELLKRGSGPYFYLPKLESHLEARLWNDVFNYSQDQLDIPRGTIRATVLIETILAAFEMDEILYELKDHSAGLNAGRWDYLFSIIKKFHNTPGFTQPDRIQLSMTVPFMKSYTDLLVATCHKRKAHAMGGMAAFIPSRRNVEINTLALKKVTEDKEREANDGFDGTWIAHPDLVAVAYNVFDKVLGTNPNQINKDQKDISIKQNDIIDFKVPGGKVTESGVRNNISVAIQYLSQWFLGVGAVGIFNLMEDAATAEISRSQLWIWHKQKANVEGPGIFSVDLYKKLRDEEIAKLPDADYNNAKALLDSLILNDKFDNFLTIRAYEYLD